MTINDRVQSGEPLHEIEDDLDHAENQGRRHVPDWLFFPLVVLVLLGYTAYCVACAEVVR